MGSHIVYIENNMTRAVPQYGIPYCLHCKQYDMFSATVWESMLFTLKTIWHVQCHSMGSHIVYILNNVTRSVPQYGNPCCLHWKQYGTCSGTVWDPILFTFVNNMTCSVSQYGIPHCLHFKQYDMFSATVWDPILFTKKPL